jgi:glycosyltransferase involved in cell wall biosynthesis
MFRIVCRGWNCAPYIDACIKSLQAQTVTEWTATLMIDKSDDVSVDKAKLWAMKDKRIEVFSNTTRMGVCYNMYRGIELAGKDPDDIICTVDLDDMLTPDALELVSETYRKNPEAMCTYGSFMRESTGVKSDVCRPVKYTHIPTNKVRLCKWRYSHLKTFKFGVFKYIPKEYFMHKDKWGSAASDLALMFSVIETVGIPRCKCIGKPIYIYRDKSEITLNRGTQLKWAARFRRKKPLEKRY